MMESLELFYKRISDADRELLVEYLATKKKSEKKKDSFNIVMDLLHGCNLKCVGCGTNAHELVADPKENGILSDIRSIETACKKIKDHAEYLGKPVFINLGGGEPFLRKDILDIVDMIYSFFGEGSIGIDTNATLPQSLELIKRVLPKIAYLGISINGLREYHNWYCGGTGFDAYERAINTIRQLCEDEENRSKIEVTSVATRKNIKELPLLFKELSLIGLENYSVHRAIPVGRMMNNMDLIPTAMDYLVLLIDLIKVGKDTDASFHIHHSIENIHRALLLGDKTYCKTKVGDRNQASSIGISPEGDVVFDAWCMDGVWRKITCGNIFESDLSILEMMNNANLLFAQVCKMTDMEIRCEGCVYPCAGGNRVVAAATKMAELAETDLNTDQIQSLFKSIDPACPLY